MIAESQHGLNIETMGCTGYSTNLALRLIFKAQYGLDINISDRFVNKISGTTKNGNTVDAPIDAIRHFGFLTEKEYPWDHDSFTWEEYYKEIPQNLKELALTRLNDWDFIHEYVPVNPQILIKALETSPIVGGVYAWLKDGDIYYDGGLPPNHLTTIIVDYEYGKYWLCADSYSNDFNYKEEKPEMFLKKLDWNYNFRFAKRYMIIDKRDSKRR